MKGTLIFALFVSAAVACCAEEKYTSKFDNVNIDEILKNDRIFKKYVGCLLDDKICTADARELKALLPEALSTNCEKCTERQKAGSEKVIAFVAKNKPDVWVRILEKYDKDNVYRTKYADQAKKLGVPI